MATGSSTRSLSDTVAFDSPGAARRPRQTVDQASAVMFRYRLSTLLVVVSMTAVGVLLWLRLIAPNVAGLSVSGGNLVVHMTDEYAQRTFANSDELQTLTGVTGGAGQPLFHDAYLSFPLYIPMSAIILLIVVLGGAIFVIRRLSTRPPAH